MVNIAFYNNVEVTFYQCDFGRSFRTNSQLCQVYERSGYKEKIGRFEDDYRMQHCSAIATRSLVQKKEDPGAFTIPCYILRKHYVIWGQA